MYLQLDGEYPELWKLADVARRVEQGDVGVIPTDTCYAFVCSVRHKKSIERLYRLKDLDPKKPLSILCTDLRMVSEYTRGMHTSAYRVLKRCLPGPYTFILKAGGELPKIMTRKRKTVGVRIPDDPICEAMFEDVEAPLLCTSVRTPDDAFWTDPAAIADTFGPRLDFVVDGGERLADPSTVVDFTEQDPVVLRAGKGDVAPFE